MPALDGLKTITADRYLRLKNGLATHASQFSPEFAAVLNIAPLYALGDQFVADHAVEAAAEPAVAPLHRARAEAELELKIAFNEAKNFVQGIIGEHRKDELALYVKTGTLLEKAIYLRNALREHPEVAARVGTTTVANLEREITEYQDAVAALGATASTASVADHATDDAVLPLMAAIRRATLYLTAWTNDIGRPELMDEFVLPRVVRKKSATPTEPPAAAA